MENQKKMKNVRKHNCRGELCSSAWNKYTNQTHGVTLIALIVTIIILLILAGAAINMAVGADGIFSKASDAVDKHNNAVAEEGQALQNLIDMADSYVIGESGGGTGPKLVGNVYTDTNGDTAYVPDGFTPSTKPGETIIEDGLVVISDIDQSEFVWVPIPNPVFDVTGAGSDLAINSAIAAEVTAGRYPMAIEVSAGEYKGVLYNVALNGTSDGVDITAKAYSTSGTSYREPDILPDTMEGDSDSHLVTYEVGATTQAAFKTQLQTEFNGMVESVVEKGGFYIGRYETSWTGSVVKSIPNVVAMTSEVGSGNTWYGMYVKQKTYDTDGVMNSGMIWGSEWDQVMIWMKDVPNPGKTKPFYILDSTDMGWYNDNYSIGNPTYKTGVPVGADANRVKNIYDLAGNLFDWTMEARDSARVGRRRLLRLSGFVLSYELPLARDPIVALSS